MTEIQGATPQPVETVKQVEVTQIRASVNAILHPNFIDHPDKKPDGVVWPKVKSGEQTAADQVWKNAAIDVDGRSVSLYNYLDDTKGVFDSLATCLTPEQIAKLPTHDVNGVMQPDLSGPQARLTIIQGLVEQIDREGMDKFAGVISQIGDIQSTDALEVLQALGVAYANDIINAAAEPQTKTVTTETTIRKARRHVERAGRGRLQMPSEFARTLKDGEDKKTLELSKKTNGLFRTPDDSPTREYQRPVEVDLRVAVALQDILLPPGERLARIRLEQQIATKKAARTARETTTQEGDELNKILKKLVSDEEATAEIDTLTSQLEQMRQRERAAILVGLKVGYEDGSPAVTPPVDPQVQELAGKIQERMPSILSGKILEQNRLQTAQMLEETLETPLSDAQKGVLETYLSGTSIQTRTSSEAILKELGLDAHPQKDILLRVLADGRRVTTAYGSLSKKQDSYAKVNDTYTRGTLFDMGLKGVEYLYRQGDITSEVVVDTTQAPTETTTETITPTPELIRADIPHYVVDESPLTPEPVTPPVDETPEITASEDPDKVDISKISQTVRLPGDPTPEDVAFAERILARRKAEREVQEHDTPPAKPEEKAWPVDNSADSDLGVGMPGFNTPPEVKPNVEEKAWPVDRSDEVDAGVGSVYGEPGDTMPPQFAQILENDLQRVEDTQLDESGPPPEAPTTVETGKEKKKRPSKESQKEVAAYHIWEKRTSGDANADQERARAEINAHAQDQVDDLQSQIVLAEQAGVFEPTDEQIRLPSQVRYEDRRRSGAPEISSPEDQTADWEEAKKHLIELRKQAAEEAQALLQARLEQAKLPPPQAEIDTRAYAHFDHRVTGTDKTDYAEAEQILKLKVGTRALGDLQHLGFSQQEIITLGRLRDKAEMLKKINEKNTALGYPLWTDDTATRRYVAYGVREARHLQETQQAQRTTEIASLVDAIVLKKMGQEGLARLVQMGVDTKTLIALDGDDQAIASFIKQQGWENNDQTVIFVRSVIEAAKI